MIGVEEWREVERNEDVCGWLELLIFVNGKDHWRSDMYLVEYRPVGKGCGPEVRTLRALAKQENFIDIHALLEAVI